MPVAVLRWWPEQRSDSSSLAQCLVEIVPEVLGMFETDTQTKKPVRHVLLTFPAPPSINGALNAAETRAANDQLKSRDNAIGGFGVAHFKGNHGAEAVQLRRGSTESRVRREPGVVHDGHVRVSTESLSEEGRRTLLSFKSNGQRAK